MTSPNSMATRIPSDADVDLLLRRLSEGDAEAKRRLFELAMAQLRRAAHGLRSQEAADHSWWTDDLLNELYQKVPERERFEDLGGFVRWSRVVMRHLLVDHARRRRRLADRLPSSDVDPVLDALVDAFESSARVSLLDLEAALALLRAVDERLATVIELRYFGFYDLTTIANELGVTTRQVHNLEKQARAHLRRFLDDPE